MLQRGIVLISGLPESGYTENDIVKLATPCGVPTEVIIATAEGKVQMVIVPESYTCSTEPSFSQMNVCL